MVARCKASTAAGSPCSAQPVRDSGYCYWHDPVLATDRDDARRRGGSNRSNRSRAKKAAAGMDMTEIEALLVATFKSVLVGKVTPGQATSAAAVAKVLLAYREAGAIEELTARLDELERIAARGRSA